MLSIFYSILGIGVANAALDAASAASSSASIIDAWGSSFFTFVTTLMTNTTVIGTLLALGTLAFIVRLTRNKTGV